eukprot:TRINITY_DN826_c2_g1_i1.p1 TRINITY_DN826_c2_g1~~TRINITY_DN826_c2_g1_i1.p1  ORF type:complete len:529 (-),score=137.71 TRINITY_DN826_c2_g1_i1:177-1763(-)
MDKDTEHKVKKMKDKTDYCRKTFNLPETEHLIQDYSCAMWRSPLNVRGRCYITFNYILWDSPLCSSIEKIPFSRVKLIKQGKSWLIASAIIVELTSGEDPIHLSGFSNTEESFSLLCHLHAHPPTFKIIQRDDDDYSSPAPPAVTQSAPNAKITQATPPNNYNQPQPARSNRATGEFGDWDAPDNSFTSSAPTYSSSSSSNSSTSGSYGTHQTYLNDASIVDTKASRLALQKAREARGLGVESLEMLADQAEQIDRIEDKVGNINYNLDKSDRLIRGMEGIGGVIKNQFSSGPVRKTTGKVDHTIVIPEKRIAKITVDILIKHSNDNLTPGKLVFDQETFWTLNNKNQIDKGSKWSYNNVDRIVVRARPLHFDVRFLDKNTPRFRSCSSDIQIIVNEFFLRVRGVKVVFESEFEKFDYGSELEYSSTGAKGYTSGADGFYQNSNKQGQGSMTRLLSDNVSKEVKDAVRQQEKDMDELYDVVGDLGNIAKAMGTELDRQNEQLDRVNGETRRANERIHNNQNRVQLIGR